MAHTRTKASRRGFTRSSLKYLLLLVDSVLIAGAWFVSARLSMPEPGLLQLVVMLVPVVVGLYLVEGYDIATYRRERGLTTRVLIGTGLAAIPVGIATFFFPELRIGRARALEFFLAVTPVLVLWRKVGAPALRARLEPLRVAVIGTGSRADALARDIAESVGFGLVTRADCHDEDVRKLIDDGVQLVSVVASAGERAKAFDCLVELRYAGVVVEDYATTYERIHQRLPVEVLEPGWVAFQSRFEGWDHDFEAKAKRLLDVSIAALVVVVMGFPMLFIAAAIRMTSPGPALYRQTRVGRFGEPYTLVKFRSMRADAEADGAVWAAEADPRTTLFGAFLRRSHLDELPQIWNVIRGDMSLVGPRPERPEFVRELASEIPYYHLRHVVKPGVTGWAQVRYPYGASVEDARRKLEYDLYYIRHKSLLWDLRIILRTLTVSVLGRGSR